MFWRATVKAGTQERCKVRHDERASAHCKGVHGYRQPPSLIVSSLAGSGATAKSVRQFVSLGR